MANGVHWSTLYLGNLTEMDTDESTRVVETEEPILRTFGAGPGEALSNNIVDVTSYAGDDDAVVTDNIGSNEGVTYNVGNGDVKQHIDSVLEVKGTVTFHDGSTFESTFGVFQTENGDTFMMALDSQPELASQGIDSVTFTSVASSDYACIQQSTKDDNKFVCFGPGTRIDTPLGPRRVDKLSPGDLVTTLDDGPQPIRWIGKRRLFFGTREERAHPVQIRRAAFGPGLPRRALMMSPNHRVLVETQPSHALHDPLGALAPAKALTRLPGIRVAKGRRAITYFSLLLPMHAVIIAEGMAVESLYPGRQSWAALSGPERSAWLRLARTARVTGNAPARLMLSTAEARAGLEDGAITLPATAPLMLTWSARHRRARAMANARAAG